MTKDIFGAVRSAASRHCRKDKMPVGTVVIRLRDYKTRKGLSRFIKIRDGGPKSGRWILFARWWWQQNRGPIPAGKIVIHRDGNELNDRPENLELGTPGTKLVRAHKKDPKWSHDQHRRAAEACAEFNRMTGKLNRLRAPLRDYWYPVLDRARTILDVPFRHRRKLVSAFGVDVSDYPRNGRARRNLVRTARETGIYPVQGHAIRLLEADGFVRINPEFRIGIGSKKEVEERISLLVGTDVWSLAEIAAQKDSRERK